MSRTERRTGACRWAGIDSRGDARPVRVPRRAGHVAQGTAAGRVMPPRLLDGLNDAQRAAVTHFGTPLLIVAGAGSGKTRVLTNRIAYLLAAREVHPGEIIAITFTNKAAGEMKERVAALVGSRARLMWVSTFHSACVRILRAEHEHAGLKSTFSIYDADDSRRLMQLVGARAGPRPEAAPGPQAGRPGVQPQERADRRRDARPTEAKGPDAADRRRGLRALPAPPPGGARARLRRPDHDRRSTCSSPTRRRRALPPPLPARAGRRVPGHQPRAVRAGQGAGRQHRRAVRGRRRRPVDLRVPRRDDPQHPRVRAGLPATPARSCSSRTTARPRRS